MTIYYGPGLTPNPGEFPSLLALGDSWFWYPKNNLLEALARHRRLKDPFRHIQVFGYNGRTLASLLSGRDGRNFLRELETSMHYYSALLVSGGGNDAVDYGLALNDDCSGATTAKACIDSAGLDALVFKLQGHISAIINVVQQIRSRKRLRNPFPIVLHGYDYPVPDGRGFQPLPKLTVLGPWLEPAMEQARVPPGLRVEVLKVLIDALGKGFRAFADRRGQPKRNIHFVASAGTLRHDLAYRDDWDNELHPTRAGFDRIVDRKWIPVMRRLGFAKR